MFSVNVNSSTYYTEVRKIKLYFMKANETDFRRPHELTRGAERPRERRRRKGEHRERKKIRRRRRCLRKREEEERYTC